VGVENERDDSVSDEGGHSMTERPAYLRVADDLRAGIRDATYPPGSPLPSLRGLAAQYGLSEIVIRAAFAVLRNEGLVTTQARSRTVVRQRPPVRLRIATERYQRELQHDSSGEPETSFTADQEIPWEQYHLGRTFREVEATPELAALFEIEPGTMLLERRFVFSAGGEPQQMSLTYLPLELVVGTPVADPQNEPWPGGTPAQLASLGHPVSRVEESIKARMPTPEEMETLHIAPGVPVFSITRRMISQGRVLEVAADIVIPADQAILDYAIDLQGPPASAD
jgi:GntR family transcriptional regulator